MKEKKEEFYEIIKRRIFSNSSEIESSLLFSPSVQ
jgi:hypothetical protein